MNRGTAWAGMAAAVLAVASRAQVIYTDAPAKLPWPATASGAIVRAESGQLTGDGVVDAIVLRGGELWLLHAPGLFPNFQSVMSGCSDFAVLPPGANGLSRVAVTKADGLWVCEWSSANAQLLPVQRVATTPWNSATKLAVAPLAGGPTCGIAAVTSGGTKLAFAYLSGLDLEGAKLYAIGSSVLGVTPLEFDTHKEGLELAYATATEVMVLVEGGNEISGPYSTLNGFVRLARNPDGGTDADSLALVLHVAVPNYTGDVLTEVDRIGWSGAILCGQPALTNLQFTSFSNDAYCDVIMSSQVCSTAWVLHGTPQVSQGYPFTLLANELTQIPFTGDDYSPALVNPQAIGGDFDHDGKTDVCVFAANHDECFMLAREPFPQGIEADPQVNVQISPVLDTYSVTFGVTVNTGWATNEAPNRAIFEVWLRDPEASPSYVEPGPWVQHIENINGDNNYTITLGGTLPQGFTASSVLLYMQAHVKRVDNNVTVLRSTATSWVYSLSSEALQSVLCHEQDRFFDPDMCGDNGPLVQGFNRRANVRPFQDGVSPYGPSQYPP